MLIMGISTLDLKNAGWNLVVGAGVASGCGLVAYCVKKIGMAAFKSKDPIVDKTKGFNFSKWAGIAAGIGIAVYVNAHGSTYRITLINDPAIGKMLKLGLVQTIAGLILDCCVDNENPVFMILGATGAMAGHWSRYGLISFGALGALVGVDHVQLRNKPFQ
jgi:hypothetical protein